MSVDIRQWEKNVKFWAKKFKNKYGDMLEEDLEQELWLKLQKFVIYHEDKYPDKQIDTALVHSILHRFVIDLYRKALKRYQYTKAYGSYMISDVMRSDYADKPSDTSASVGYINSFLNDLVPFLDEGEREVLRWLCKGYSPNKIAGMISHSTHLSKRKTKSSRLSKVLLIQASIKRKAEGVMMAHKTLENIYSSGD